MDKVAPLVGAWIEIIVSQLGDEELAVAPLVGAWIEIFGELCELLASLTSLPSWERGLKSHCPSIAPTHNQSLPSWERGLKSVSKYSTTRNLGSLPSWERGLKFRRLRLFWQVGLVAPLVGAWIEMIVNRYRDRPVGVAPLVGAWIEIIPRCSGKTTRFVAPLVGAWIEINLRLKDNVPIPSLPSWERGLKSK